MDKGILTNRQGFRIPHADMVNLKRQGMLNLGVENDLATKIAGMTNLGPKKTTAVIAFHFWNWVGFIVLLGSIYWSFTKNWWWFIGGFIIWRALWSANKTANAENFLDAAMVDKDFYDRVLEMNGWMYQVKKTDAAVFSQYLNLENAETQIEKNEQENLKRCLTDRDLIADFGDFLQANDATLTMWNESALPHPKETIQRALIREIKENADPEMQKHLRLALLYTCNFSKKIDSAVTKSAYEFLERNNEKVSELTVENREEVKKIANEWIKNQEENRTTDKIFDELQLDAIAEYESLLKELGETISEDMLIRRRQLLSELSKNT